MSLRRKKIKPSLRISPSNKKNRSIKYSTVKNKSGKKIEEDKIDRLQIGATKNRKAVKKRRNKKGIKTPPPPPIKKEKAKKEKGKYLKLSKWKNLLKGHPAFILGNGPSISGCDLSLLDNYFTIGINRIFYIYTPVVLFWQDIGMWKTDKDNILKCKSIKVCRDLSDPRKMFVNFKLGLNPLRFTNNPSKYYGRGNTGALAVQMAVSLGCSSVVLLGTDCKYDKKGNTDFYGKNKDHSPMTLSRCYDAMKWVKKKCPIPVYNCSRIDLWPRRKLEDVINEIGPEQLKRKSLEKIFLK